MVHPLPHLEVDMHPLILGLYHLIFTIKTPDYLYLASVQIPEVIELLTGKKKGCAWIIVTGIWLESQNFACYTKANGIYWL